jgi:hypothetical protein
MTAPKAPSIPARLAAIIREIDRTGHADVLRLTVLKKWERGYLPGTAALRIRPAPRGSGNDDVSVAHDRYLASS